MLITANEITAKKAKANIKSLLAKANKETGKEHTNLSDAFEDLALGYGVDQTEVFDGNIELEGEFEPGEPEITDYYQNGYKEGYSKGLEDGGGEGSFEEGKKAAYEEIQGLNAELEQTLYGTDTGGKSFYDEFWDEAWSGGSFIAKFAGNVWTKKNFRPNKSFAVTGNANYIFYNNGYVGSLTELAQTLDIDIILQPTSLTNAFAYSKITECKVDCSRLSNLNSVFADASLVTLELIGVLVKHTFNSAFTRCSNLVNLLINGTIGQNGLDLKDSTKLSKASWVSIVGCYSTTISGLSMTGSLASVNKAFETSEGANDGSTSAEWLNLIATKSNVSFNLV